MAFKPPDYRRVFEFGAAKATDLLAFQAAGWEIEGCEPSEQACRLAAAQNIKLQNATAEDAVLAAGAYSCILFNNVFEHIHDPVGVLGKCHRALRPGGVLIAVVPNHRSWTGRLFGAAWPGYDAPRHLWGWTPKSIQQQFNAAGFAVRTIYHHTTGTWMWRSTLDMRHSPAAPGKLRLWMSRHGLLAGLAFSALAATMGHGDFIHVIATREPD